MKTQEAIIELIAREPLPAAKIASHLAISEGYIRTQLKAMELSGLIEKVDERLPYYYRPAPQNLLVQEAEKVLKAKAALLSVGEDKNPIRVFIKSLPKTDWAEVANVLRIHAAAIDQMNKEGLLIDTL